VRSRGRGYHVRRTWWLRIPACAKCIGEGSYLGKKTKRLVQHSNDKLLYFKGWKGMRKKI
jgi:hypothetical protein